MYGYFCQNNRTDRDFLVWHLHIIIFSTQGNNDSPTTGKPSASRFATSKFKSNKNFNRSSLALTRHEIGGSNVFHQYYVRL